MENVACAFVLSVTNTRDSSPYIHSLLETSDDPYRTIRVFVDFLSNAISKHPHGHLQLKHTDVDPI